MNDTFLFAEDTHEEEHEFEAKWKTLVIDDEPEVHNITKIVLKDISFEGGGLELVSAYSGAEAKQLMLESGDEFAVAIVDVVMESNHAGLDFVKWVREELNNHKIRLILRTGQPGEAPEESVIRDYDINDYKNKTELTALRLKTTFYSALRGYRDILIIERHRQGLEKIISATSVFIECDTLPQFASAILRQVALVLGIDEKAIICCAAAKDAKSSPTGVNILALNQSTFENDNNKIELPEEVNERLRMALEQKHSIYEKDYFIGYFTTKRGNENLLYVSQDHSLEPMQHNLLEFFANNIAVAHENLKLRDVIKESQKELSYVIGEAVEMRSKETGSHVKRVATISHMLAVMYGLPDYEAEMIKLASPLHDVGKVGIPDHILNKPGKHTEDEWQIMQQHAEIGYTMLCKSDNPILQMGAIIAHQHHEKWDGSGYPTGLSGKQIHIAGRITALADVFDALGSNRCYKKAWPISDIVEHLKQSSGSHFEPKLVEILLDNIDAFCKVREDFPDTY
jgi:response regulator RpfG family c-di-GMP phosphodiesterase